MKGAKAVLLVAVVCVTLLAGCSTDVRHAHDHDPAHEAQHRAEVEASVNYFVENFPSRDETLRVRECITARTGFDGFPEMPAEYGPDILTPVPGETPREMPPEVDRAEIDCIFDLRLQDRYIPPWDQESLRNANSS